jgi:hypothetical protein
MAASLVTTASGIGALPWGRRQSGSSPGVSRSYCLHHRLDRRIVYHETARNTARIRIVADLFAEYLDARNSELSGRRPA